MGLRTEPMTLGMQCGCSYHCAFGRLACSRLSDNGADQKMLERTKEKRVGLGDGGAETPPCLPHPLGFFFLPSLQHFTLAVENAQAIRLLFKSPFNFLQNYYNSA